MSFHVANCPHCGGGLEITSKDTIILNAVGESILLTAEDSGLMDAFLNTMEAIQKPIKEEREGPALMGFLLHLAKAGLPIQLLGELRRIYGEEGFYDSYSCNGIMMIRKDKRVVEFIPSFLARGGILTPITEWLDSKEGRVLNNPPYFNREGVVIRLDPYKDELVAPG